jgi:hypothetical protein
VAPPARPRCTTAQRRARLVARHHLGGTATDARTAVDAVVAMHATDPVTPHLGVEARVHAGGVHDLDAALHDRRDLWRLHAMRRTLFVVTVDLAPVVTAAAGADVAATERRKLRGWVGSALPADTEVDAWLAEVTADVVAALADGEPRSTKELVATVPALATRIRLGSGRWSTESPLSSRLLFLLAMDGLLVRAQPAGTWRSSQYRWARTRDWFATAPVPLDPAAARTELARRYLGANGPVTLTDLRWWTGWTAARSRAALAALGAVEVQLDGGDVGYVVADDLPHDPTERADTPSAALLPGLDPTTMGWKQRDWFLGGHDDALFDTTGNGGPTVWVDGRIVGGWGQRPDGEVVVGLLEDVGADTRAAIDARAAAIGVWLDGTVVAPRFPTPLTSELSAPHPR